MGVLTLKLCCDKLNGSFKIGTKRKQPKNRVFEKGGTKMEQKIRLRKNSFLNKTLRALYTYRGWWVDFPSLSLLALFHWHFYSQGVHPVHGDFPETFWAILGMYLVIKEGVRWKLHEISSRRGSILVSLWLGSLIEFFIVYAMDSHKVIPPQMIETTLIVLGSFLGILPIKRYYSKKFPALTEIFEPHNAVKH